MKCRAKATFLQLRNFKMVAKLKKSLVALAILVSCNVVLRAPKQYFNFIGLMQKI